MDYAKLSTVDLWSKSQLHLLTYHPFLFNFEAVLWKLPSHREASTRLLENTLSFPKIRENYVFGIEINRSFIFNWH
jgi:hypothetical protein